MPHDDANTSPLTRPTPAQRAPTRQSRRSAYAPTSPSPATRSAGRADNDKLRHRLRLQLGAEIDGPDRAELITRVADLESLTRQLLAERDARAAEADSAKPRIHDLEDDLTAARESLRRVIKDHNRPQP